MTVVAIALWCVAGLAPALGAPIPRQAIRIAFEVPRSAVSLRRGIDFGLAEAQRTAGVLGLTIESGVAPVTIRGPVVTIVSQGRSFRVSPIDAGRVAWLPTLEKFGAGELNQRFLREMKHPMDEDAWLGWVAVKIVAEAALRNRDIARIRIDGHKGVPLYFDDAGNLVQPLYDKR
jgi:hypothetical protein